MSPAASVITLTYNKLAVTRRCLPTWLETAAPFRWELVVVDNGSSDGTVEWLNEFAESADAAGVSFRLIVNETNIGCSTARNMGVAHATGRRLVFMDNDVALRTRSWMTCLDQALSELPQAAVAGAKLVYPFTPYDIQCAGVAISPNGRVQFRGRGEPRTTAEYNETIEVQCLISACWMMTRDAFDRAGGLDEAFNPVQFEDFDLCYRVREKGCRCFYVPAAEMYHFESTTTAGTPDISNARVVVTNGLRFKQRWQHMFSKENGPPDEQCRWRQLDIPGLTEIPQPPLIDGTGQQGR